MTFAGPLDMVVSIEDGLTSMTIPATGRAGARVLKLVVTDPSLQVDSSSEVPGTSGLAYLAARGWSTLYAESSAAALDGVLAWDEGTAEPVLSGSIITGGISLNILLSDPDAPIQTEPAGLEQFAELVPLPESSLALAATLWTVPSDSSTSSPSRELSAATAADPDARSTSASSWVLLVTGTDQALEQTNRDICDGISFHGIRQPDTEGRSRGPDELLEWQGPILPAAQGQSPDTEPESRRIGPGATFDHARQQTVPTRHGSQLHSEDRQANILGFMPMLSVVSVSTVIAGWIYRQRQRLRRPRPRGNGSRARESRGPSR